MAGAKDLDPLQFFGKFGKASKQTPGAAKDNSKDSSGKAAKPCRVCDSFKSWRVHEAKTHRKEQGDQSAATTAATAAAAATTAAASRPASLATSLTTLAEDDCPPDSQVLGRATWTFLHTMAAYYPDRADPGQQTMMKSLLSSFSHFYPCGRCASHLRLVMAKDPPPVDSRQSLSQWLCQTHNKVNVMLGKDEFDCSKVDERWRDGPKDGRCSWAQDVEY
ncbi:Flavin-linked sulfhydryl oxidase of the mitochondrial IMS [Coemansia thaxteri]|uniref:Sulfhydryl oxidase n=1 Tax=Coemansia thaxteri TaxID=2663907 RepID=A0A9W8EHR5_9FUNG|nr:Flavin-linked sulfhydryl oxidase of the mitochondrial IMS [Coemansia thaxteri]KAJ2484280.1 Flavin-linked sulfhydryl oxidase of the mitochondrial IMS [Coemansia sp. RSA 2320]